MLGRRFFLEAVDMASGKCGKDLTWTLDNGTLTISGTGKMKNYGESSSPWWKYRGAIEKIIICDGVTSIGDWVFSCCRNLAEIKIPDGVTYIGDWAFYVSNSLTEIKLPDSITSIGKGAFGFCESLKEITIPDGVTTIDRGAFICCRSLTEIKIPANITSIDESAFYECESLEKIYCRRDTGFEKILSEGNGAKLIQY